MQNQYYRRMNKVDYETWAKAFPKVGPTELELEQHAALKDAWDQYNTIRALCGLSVKL
jgi:hypothetical protein